MGINNISAKRVQVYEAIKKFLSEEAEIFRAREYGTERERFFYEHLRETRVAIDGMLTHLDEKRSTEIVRLG